MRLIVIDLRAIEDHDARATRPLPSSLASSGAGSALTGWFGPCLKRTSHAVMSGGAAVNGQIARGLVRAGDRPEALREGGGDYTARRHPPERLARVALTHAPNAANVRSPSRSRQS
jgi:hypothetical protein